MAQNYDVVVLGSGNAGMAAARVAREAGRSVAIVERREEVGGTCPLRGCVPKKVLVAAAEVWDSVKSAGDHAITVDGASLDWAGLIAREKSFIAGTSENFENLLKKRGIDLLRGEACFVGRNALDIGSQRVNAGKTVIATGSVPRPLPFEGSEHLIDNEDILNETTLPGSVIFIGGGVIAMEFAHVYARAGADVTILEVAPRLLPSADADAAGRLRKASEKLGIKIHTEAKVEVVVAEGATFSVRFTENGESNILSAMRVAHGAGRIPAVEDLALDAGGIEHDGPKIAVTAYLASVSNGDVYVAGDARAGHAQLSPIASYEGDIVGRNLVEGDVAVPDERSVPQVVYTVPALASVGLTAEAAEEEGLEVEVVENNMSGWLSSKLYGGGEAYAKVLTEKKNRRIAGAHLFGKRAEELIHLFAFAMKFGITADEMSRFIYAFPTFSSDVKSLV